MIGAILAWVRRGTQQDRITLAAFDRFQIAERLRALIGEKDGEEMSALAQRLCVEELSLRMSVDELSPHPTVEVLSAVIRDYGVDPTWLLTGVYDAATHRSSMENGASAVLREFTSHRPSPIAELPPEHFRITGQN